MAVSGAYDFSAGTLSHVAEKLTQESQDFAGAIELMKLNVEVNPEEPNAHLMLGRLYMVAGDREAAVASMERSLELDPENQFAKRMLEQIRSSD